MGINDMSSPWDMRTSFWAISIVLVVGVYLFPIVAEYLRRDDHRDAMEQRWVAACSAATTAETCTEELDAHGKFCLEQARTVHRDNVVFGAADFFECMNQRNGAQLVVPVPDPEPWEL